MIIEHVGGSQILAGTIHKQRGERVRVEVRKTETLCYSFNFRVKTDEVGQPASNAIDFNDTVAFETMFWGDPLLLEIEAIRLPGTTDADCGQGGERKTGGALPPWQVRVTTDGWDIFFSGAFTADKLTDPVFALVSEDRDLDLTDTDTTKTKGFVVRQSEEDDEFRLAAAAMTHVLHSNPDRFNFGDINWVPLSFGLGISDNSQARYYLGTGIRFGQKFFLTAGAAVGPVKRLPATLSLDANDKRNFTTDANALSSLQTRNESAFFVGISYSFAGVGPSNFSGPFTPVKPAPSGATQAPAPAPAAPVTPPTTTTPPITPVTPTPTPVTANSVTLTTTDAAPTGRNAMYNIVVEVPTGGSSTPVEIAHTFYDAAALAAAPTVVCTVTGPGGPAHPCPQPPITFPLKITIDPGTKYTLSTLMTFNSDTHAEKDLPVTLKHGTPAVTITKSVKVK
ncbi:MAG TPA: hypothetical protein VF432_08135 [Thermoanaerobaculia bacterium]